MCGIVGYVGHRDAAGILVRGLRKLEYRGYDSSGVCTITAEGRLAITKSAGRIDQLAARLKKAPSPGQIGIGHTRWATHGAATDQNAHPHVGGNDLLAVVHNGVIENFRTLKERLEGEGYRFRSGTDTEVIAHLIASCLEHRALAKATLTRRASEGAAGTPVDSPALPRQARASAGIHTDATRDPVAAGHGDAPSLAPRVSDADDAGEYAHLVAAVNEALSQLQGTYGLAIVFRGAPGVIIAARRGSPLVIGVGNGEHFLASDPAALVGYTDKIVYLSDHELAVVTADSLRVTHRDQGDVEPDVHVLQWQDRSTELGGHAHYMLKEIFEQPESLENTMRGRLDIDAATAHFGGLNLTARHLRRVNRIIMTACGTSWHAALVGEYMIEELARLPVEVEYASELRYRNPPMDRDTLLFAITQSGETADTLAALREMKRKGHPTLAICNVVGSSIAREADGGIYLHAGPEIGVASTKAFTSQVAALAMLALHFGRLRHLSYSAGQRIIEHLRQLPEHVRETLRCHAAVKEIAEKYHRCSNFLYLGRQYNFPVALEGALKLKEISYIHAEGYPAAEMKHGPIALVDEHTPSVFLLPEGPVYDKVFSNMEEVKARGGPVIAVVTRGDKHAPQVADDLIEVPQVDEFLQPIINILPLQILAYHIALLRGCDVDKPRNLAKSVTVE
jgi:glucosamine--fructose-6-phosphate aminotransferase (isomerizing)